MGLVTIIGDPQPDELDEIITDEPIMEEPEPVTGGLEPEMESDPEPLTPEGNMTLVDDIQGEASEDKEFIVVTSRGGHYFYIIIDHAAEGENTVHFLNQVDEADLLSIIEEEEAEPAVCSCTTKCAAGMVNTYCEVCAVNMSECAGIEPEPEPEEPETPEEPEVEEQKAGVSPLVILLVVALAGGGAVYYLKFMKKTPDTRGSADLDDYDYGDEDEDESEEEPENEDEETEPDFDDEDE